VARDNLSRVDELPTQYFFLCVALLGLSLYTSGFQNKKKQQNGKQTASGSYFLLFHFFFRKHHDTLSPTSATSLASSLLGVLREKAAVRFPVATA